MSLQSQKCVHILQGVFPTIRIILTISVTGLVSLCVFHSHSHSHNLYHCLSPCHLLVILNVNKLIVSVFFTVTHSCVCKGHCHCLLPCHDQCHWLSMSVTPAVSLTITVNFTVCLFLVHCHFLSSFLSVTLCYCCCLSNFHYHLTVIVAFKVSHHHLIALSLSLSLSLLLLPH